MSILIAIEKSTGRRIHIDEYKDEEIHCNISEEHKLIAKRGSERVHHFCHKSGTDCIAGKGKTSFHLYWQNRVQPQYLEVRMENHIADIKINDMIIEIQHSKIKKEVIQEREKFYKNMVWIFDCQSINCKQPIVFKNLVKIAFNGGGLYFLRAKKTSYLDFGFRGVLKIIQKMKNIIWCEKITLDQLDQTLFKNSLVINADKRLDLPFYNVSEVATQQEYEKFLNKDG